MTAKPGWNAATVLMMLLGAAALGFAAWQGGEAARFLAGASRATGTVVAEGRDPVIRFPLAAGGAAEFRAGDGRLRAAGDAVPVAFRAEDPGGTARVASFWALWGLALLPLPMGLGFLLLPLFGARAEWRPGRW